MNGGRLAVLLLLVVSCSTETIRIFVHIPKTGGTTFRHIFAQDCKRTWTFFADAPGTVRDLTFILNLLTQKNYTCFQGHMSWELVDALSCHLPQDDVITFILLRDPTARLISQYHYEQAIFNRSYAPDDFFPRNANVIAQYLGSNASSVIGSRATYIGITEYYHETLSYLTAVGFFYNATNVINYNTRKVHRKPSSPELFKLALEYSDKDQEIYEAGIARFFDEQLYTMEYNDVYFKTLQELNTRDHNCVNDEQGIGSGKCWQKNKLINRNANFKKKIEYKCRLQRFSIGTPTLCLNQHFTVF